MTRRFSWRDALRIRGFREWVASGVSGDSPFAVATRVVQRASPAGLKRLVQRYRARRPFDPHILELGVGKIQGKPRGYLGRNVLDLGDRHAHAIVDVPWESLKVNPSQLRLRYDARHRWGRRDPWRLAYKGPGELLAIHNPRPTDKGDRAIVEAAVTVSREIFNGLRKTGEFDDLGDGVLARRGRRKRATNIFVVAGR